MPFWRTRFGRLLRVALAAAAGAAIFGLYAQLVGCRTGTCPLTSSVWRALAYGGLVGAFVGWPGRPEQSATGAPPDRLAP